VANALDIVTTAQKQVGFYGGTTDANPYGDWYGIPNEPWCAMFISWCFAQNDLSHLVAAQTSKGFSYCPSGLSWFQQRKGVVNKYEGKPGDLVFFSWAGNGIADHVEIIVNASRDGITTIGGNTGPEHMTDASQYNGHGVYLRHRSYLYVLAIVRPEYEASLKPTSSLGTNKPLAIGTAATTALGAGGMAVHQVTSTSTPKPLTTASAPAWKASDLVVGKKTQAELIVEKALFNAGLIPAVNQNSTFTQAHLDAVKLYQKQVGLPATGKLDQVTYILLVKGIK
jgi:hypothetical protein